MYCFTRSSDLLISVIVDVQFFQKSNNNLLIILQCGKNDFAKKYKILAGHKSKK